MTGMRVTAPFFRITSESVTGPRDLPSSRRFSYFLAAGIIAACVAPLSAASIPWDVRVVESSHAPILSVTDALDLLNGQIDSRREGAGQYSAINFNLKNKPQGGLFGNDNTFPR